MKRYELINYLIAVNNYKNYLEIGTQFGECFKSIGALYKECVDPEKRFEGLTHNMTSDEYFKQNDKNFDIVFVDGLHEEHQTSVDIHNALSILNPGGTIVVHDCLPHCEEFIQVCWNGTVFRSIIDLRFNNPDLTVRVVDTDCGCGIIQKNPTNNSSLYNKTSLNEAKQYSYYESHKKDLMNVISIEEFLDLYSNG